MSPNVKDILQKASFDKQDLEILLAADENDRQLIFTQAAAIKDQYVGNKVYYRGLIEFSNICGKNCLYCGIRAGNTQTHRYEVQEDEILEAARYAMEISLGVS